MESRPNILLLTTDQQRYDTIAAMGYPYMETPSLDRLVREGCAVPLAHSPNPACIPARKTPASWSASCANRRAKPPNGKTVIS